MKEDQIICNKCNGVGEIFPKHDHFGVEMCPKCLGSGKLDWIENIIGKKYIEFDIEPIDFPRGVK